MPRSWCCARMARRARPNEPGELVHRGALVGMGYWNDPEKTAERYKPLPGREAGLVLPEIAVFSGDTVRMDEEGFLYFIGRRDEMIKTSGYRVSPDRDRGGALRHAAGRRGRRVRRAASDAGPGDRRRRHAEARVRSRRNRRCLPNAESRLPAYMVAAPRSTCGRDRCRAIPTARSIARRSAWSSSTCSTRQPDRLRNVSMHS